MRALVVNITDRYTLAGIVTGGFTVADVGRPTKLTPMLMDVMGHYIENFKEYKHLIPSIAGFSLLCDVTREQLQEWRRDNVSEDFSLMYDKLMARQEVELQSGGLSKAFSGGITAMMLTKHGYSNKTDVTNSDGSLRPQVTEITRRVVEAKKD